MLDQLFLTDRSPLIQKKILQNSILFSCQCNRLVFCICSPFSCIKTKTATFQTDIFLYKLSSCQTSHAGFQLLQMKWFFHIIICPRIKTVNLISDLTSRRQNQYLCLFIFLSKFPENIHPIHPRKVKIKHDQIIHFRIDHIQCFLSVITRVYLIPCLVQTFRNHIT